jgi:uncharacterized protein YfaS (alpha-2-macroglobulin family)
MKRCLVTLSLFGFFLSGILNANPTSRCIKEFKASSWDSWISFNYACLDKRYGCFYRQIGPKDEFLLRFDDSVDFSDLKKSLRIHQVNPQKQVKFILVPDAKQSKQTFRIKFRKPLKRGKIYRFSFSGKKFSIPYQPGKPLVFFQQCAPKFDFKTFRTGIDSGDHPVISLFFSNRLGEVSKEDFKVFLVKSQDPVTTKEMKIPQHFSLESDYWKLSDGRVELHLNRPVNFIDTYRVVVDKHITNRYGDALEKEVKVEAEIHSNRIKPGFSYRSTNGGLTFQLNNIKNIDFTLYQFHDNVPEFLKRFVSYNYYWRDFPYSPKPGYPGCLSEKGALENFIRVKKVKTFNPGCPGEDVIYVDFKKETGTEKGFFGVMVNRVEPFIAGNHQDFYSYLTRDAFPLKIIHNKTMDFVIKTDGQKSWLWCYDRETGSPIEQIDILLNHGGKTRSLKAARKGDLFHLNTAVTSSDMVIANEPGRHNTAFCTNRNSFPSIHFNRIFENTIHYYGKIFTDRDFYLPGDTLYVGGIVKPYNRFEIAANNQQDIPIVLSLKAPDGKIIHRAVVKTDRWGGFFHTIPTGKELKKGSYTISGFHGGSPITRSVRIDYFQSNGMDIRIDGLNETYRYPRIPQCVITGRYLTGNPMAGDELEYRITPVSFNPIVSSSLNPMLKPFLFELDTAFRKVIPGMLAMRQKQRLDKTGKLQVKKAFKLLEKSRCAVALNFEAVGSTAEGKEYKTGKRILYFPGNKIIGIKINSFNKIDDEVRADLVVIDSSGRLTTAKADVSILKKEMKTAPTRLKIVKCLKAKTFKRFEKLLFRLKEPGIYFIKFNTYDEKNNKTSTSASFEVKRSIASSSRDKKDFIFALTAEKKEYRAGETACVVIQSYFKGKGLVTIEQERVIDAFTIDIDNITPVTFKVKKDYLPGFIVKVIARTRMGSSREFLFPERELNFVAAEDKQPLKVSIGAPAGNKNLEISPSTTAKIRVNVTDHRGTGVKSKVFVYGVDEGILSLTGYLAPDMHHHFFYQNWEWNRSKIMTYFSKDAQREFVFTHPLLDKQIIDSLLYGRVVKPDGTPLAGVMISLCDENGCDVEWTKTSANGYYRFFKTKRAYDSLKLEYNGYITYIYKVRISEWGYWGMKNFVMMPLKKGEESRVEVLDAINFYGDRIPVPCGVTGGVPGHILGSDINGGILRMVEPVLPGSVATTQAAFRPYFRDNFQPVLFFRNIETETSGSAELEFQTSDLLTSFRIMAVAYSEDNFGNGETHITVTRNLIINESMPEFAFKGDIFTAGALVSNRTDEPRSVTTVVETENLRILSRNQLEKQIKGKYNQPVLFRFHAENQGTARITFSLESKLESKQEMDGVIKEIPVLDNLFKDTEIEYDVGRRIHKTIKLRPEVSGGVLTVTVSPGHGQLMANLSRIIFNYPYGCMEQRTTRVLPFLAMKEEALKKLDVNMTQDQVNNVIKEYLDRVAAHVTPGGGISYYRDGEPSDYLTVYVLWALQLASQNDYEVDPGLMAKITTYLSKKKLNPNISSFLQYVRSTIKQADPAVLQRLYDSRKKMSIMGKVFLYKALYHQLPDRSRTRILFQEFQQWLHVKGDEAWFEPDHTAYDRDLPFYNRRYVTAILLQAILEVEGKYRYADYVMNGLLREKSHSWRTTQNNFWILYALGQYMRLQGGKYVEVQINNKKMRKDFTSANDVFRYETSLRKEIKEIDIEIASDKTVYAVTQLIYKTPFPVSRNHGIMVKRNIYDESGKRVEFLKKGKIYQVEILIDAEKMIPYGVIDAPLPAGIELLRQDHATTRTLTPFNRVHEPAYSLPWLQEEHERCKTLYYSYRLNRKTRVVYFIKALYNGTFTWMPVKVEGMYHPRFYGQTAGQRISVL